MVRDPYFRVVDRSRGLLRPDPEREYRDLEQEVLDEVEADQDQHDHEGRVVQVDQPVQSGEIGGSWKREQDPYHERLPGVPPLQRLLPLRCLFLSLVLVARLSPLSQAPYLTLVERERRDHE